MSNASQVMMQRRRHLGMLLVVVLLISSTVAFQPSLRPRSARMHPGTDIQNARNHRSCRIAEQLPCGSGRMPAFTSTPTPPATSRLYNGMWSSDDDLEGPDRIKACVPYLLPLIDGDVFGNYIYERIPIPLGFLHELLLQPLVNIFDGIPFLSFIFFVALTLGTRGNMDMSRGVRFSAQQAAALDIALLLPAIFGEGFQASDIPRYLAEPCSNFMWYTYMAAIVYCVYSNLQGKKPNQIPFISNYAENLVGPM